MPIVDDALIGRIFREEAGRSVATLIRIFGDIDLAEDAVQEAFALARDEQDPLILQAKEATASVLAPFVGQSGHANHGERVVVGQQGMQATPDILLGWTRGPGGRDFYLRQLWDMKGSVDITTLEPAGLGFYGGICGWSLARAHAVTGDAVAIASYLGTSDKFDGAIADFAETYAAVNERDHAAYVAAMKSGRVSVPAVP